MCKRITIITVARNAEDTIEAAAKSIFTQTGALEGVEHILVDGGSTDKTVSMAYKGNPNICKHISEPDKGIYDGMNKGLAMATGDIVGFLNADDLFASNDVIESIRRCFAANSSPQVCYSDLQYVLRSDPAKVVRVWTAGAFKPGMFAYGWVPPHPTVYMRRQFIDSIGKFNLRYNLAADYEMLLRAFEVHKARLCYEPKIWVKMRLGGATNKSIRNIISGNAEIAHALRSHGIGWPPWVFFNRMLRRLPQFVKASIG